MIKRTEHHNDKGLLNHTTMVYLQKKMVNFYGRQIYTNTIECLAIGSLWIRRNPWLEQGQDTAKAGDILYKED